MKPVAYHRLAASELIKSAEFYERRVRSLGESFLGAVDQAVLKIQGQPASGKAGKFGTRSRKTKRFPFRIIYLDESDRFWIVAVAHLSRRPNYWTSRLP